MRSTEKILSLGKVQNKKNQKKEKIIEIKRIRAKLKTKDWRFESCCSS